VVGHDADAPGGGELVLYRDGAVVRVRHEVVVTGGRAMVDVLLPGDVEAGQLVARTLGDGARVGQLTIVDPALRPGDEVEIRDPSSDRVIRGVLRYIAERELVIETGGEARVILDAKHLVRVGGGGARHVTVEVLADRDGAVQLELVYPTRQLSWAADYTMVMDAAVQRAELHGALGIENSTGVLYQDSRITLIDTERPVRVTAFDQAREVQKDDKIAEPTKPRAEQPVKLKKAVATPRTTLPFGVDVGPGAQAVSLLGGSHVLTARETLVYDPVGDDRNLSGREPIHDRDYGLDKKGTAVSQSIDVDLVAAKVPTGLPAGTVRLVERGEGGELSPLGEARIFERASSDEPEKISPTTSVAIGRASHVAARRKRIEFTLDDEAKRLVEEFEITLFNKSDRQVEVIVREHLYRGLNWTLSYQSTSSVTKEGPQKIAMKQVVPAKGKAKVVYRVVYHW
jgi:hypothetical protein